MKSLPNNESFREIARSVIWFEPPEEALSDTVRFVAYAMTHATFAEMQIIRQELDDDALREVLTKAPPGVIDARSWAYWHVRLGIDPVPPQLERTFGS